MYELALKLNAKRHRRGSIDFDLPEPVIEFDPDGNMQSIVRSERGWAHRLIEEFMLSANECVATWIESNAIPGIYRIHETPDPKRILDFEETASGFGYSLGFSSLPVKRMTMKSDRRDAGETRQRRARARGPYARGCGVDSRDAADVPAADGEDRRQAGGAHPELPDAALAEAGALQREERGPLCAGQPLLHALHLADPALPGPDRASAGPRADSRGRRHARRCDSEQRSAAVETSHWIRYKYKSRSAQAGGYASEPIPEAELAAIAAESSQAERRADDAERELMEWKKMRFMEDRVGDDFQGIILSCTKYGFFVELDDLFIEGLVPIASLSGWGTDERFVFRDTDKQIVSTRTGRAFKMGQRVHVLLDRIDREQRRLQFALCLKRSSTEDQAAAQGQGREGCGVGRRREQTCESGPRGQAARGKAGKTKSRARGRDKKAKGKRR